MCFARWTANAACTPAVSGKRQILLRPIPNPDDVAVMLANNGVKHTELRRPSPMSTPDPTTSPNGGEAQDPNSKPKPRLSSNNVEGTGAAKGDSSDVTGINASEGVAVAEPNEGEPIDSDATSSVLV